MLIDQTLQPTILKLNSYEREEYIAQLGSFTQIQHSLLIELCEKKQSSINYDHFIQEQKDSSLSLQNQLILMMEKLEKARIGLILFEYQQETLKPKTIILTNTNSFYFIYYTSINEIYKSFIDKGFPFISLTQLEEKLSPIEPNFVTPLLIKNISPSQFKKGDKKLYSIKTSKKSYIIIPSQSIDFLKKATAHFIKSELKNTALLETISKKSQIKISTIHQKIDEKDDYIWLSLSKSIIENREDLLFRFKRLKDSFFLANYLLFHYQKNKIQEIQQEAHLQKTIQKAIEELLKLVQERGREGIEKEELEDLIGQKNKEFQNFKSQFEQEAFTVTEENILSPLIVLEDQVIHRAFLYPLFLLSINRTKKILNPLIKKQMKDLLEQGRSNHYPQFYSKNNFQNYLKEQVSQSAPLFKALLEMPNRVGQGQIYFLKFIKKITNPQIFHNEFNLFFMDGICHFKPIDSLLGLSLFNLFEQVYEELSWWSRFKLKLSGRYDSYISLFNDRPVKNTIKKGSKGPLYQQDRPIPPPQKSFPPPSYRIRDKKRAWDEFSDIIKKS